MYVHTDRGEMRNIQPVVSIVILDKLLKPKDKTQTVEEN